MSRRRKQRMEASSSQKASGSQSEGQGGSGRGRAARGKVKTAKAHWAIKGGGLLIALLILLAFGGYLWVRAYLRSEQFREQLGQQLGAATGGKATVGEIDWQGTAMDIGAVDLKSRQAGNWALRDVAAKIDLSGFWDKVWLVPEIEVRQARSEWDFRQELEAPVSEVERKRAQQAVQKSAGSSPGGSRYLPNRTEVHSLVVKDYEGEVVTAEGSYSWDGVRLDCEPRGQRSTLINLTGGRLQTPYRWLGALRLDSGALSIREGEVYLDRSDWEAEAGPLSLSGELAAGGAFEASIEDWALAPLLPPEWSGFVTGHLTGEFSSDKEGLVAELKAADGVVKGLPFIDRLAAYAGTPRLRRLTFEDASARVARRGELWDVTEIVLFDEGLLRVEGEFSANPEGPTGELSLGVPPGLLAHIPGAEEKVFLPGKRGLLWADVQISGTWENPKEDLSERMIRAAGERMFELIPETGLWALRHSGVALDQGTALLLENQDLILAEGTQVVEEAIEQGSGVVEEGVKTGFGILNGILGGEEE